MPTGVLILMCVLGIQFGALVGYVNRVSHSLKKIEQHLAALVKQKEEIK